MATKRAPPSETNLSGSIIKATATEQNPMQVVEKSVQDQDDNESSSTPSTTTTADESPQLGSTIKTKYGVGKIIHYRSQDGMYNIDLGQGVSLYTTLQDLDLDSNATKTTAQKQTANSTKKKKDKSKIAMELNVAYEAIEKMRRLNLEMECFERGVIVNHDRCTACLLNSQNSTRFPRLQKLVDSHHESIQTQQSQCQKIQSHQAEIKEKGKAKEDSDNNTSRTLVPDILNRAVTNTKKATEDAAALVNRAATTTQRAAVDRWNSSSSTDTNTDTNSTSTTTSITAGDTNNDSSTARFPRLHKFMDSTTKSVSSASSLRPNMKIFGGRNQPSSQGITNPTSNTTATTNTGSSTDTNNTTKSADSSFRFPRIQKLVDGATATAGAASASFSQISERTLTTTGITTSAAASSTNDLANSATPKKQKQVVLPRIQKLMDSAQNAKTSPCLICASPCCTAHSSASFRKNNITLCLDCERLFELNFIVDCCSSENENRAQHVDHMVDLYDRSLLLLKYSGQFIPQIAEQLEATTKQQNSVKLGSSGVGVVSGVLGVAAAATILTPAGPPLLIASLLFGGGATAVQTSTEAVNYFSEPNQLADRIIALHGMLLSILRVTSTLRDAMMVNHIRTDAFLDDENNEEMGKLPNVSKAGVMASANVGRSITLGSAVAVAETSAVSTVAAEAGVMAGGRATASLTRAGTAAARTLRFARFAGGALSAAVLVMEANAIQQTLKQMQSGNPCEKADNLRKIYEEIKDLPSTESLDRECQRYLKTLAERPEPTYQDMSKALEDDDGIPVAVGTPIGDIVTEKTEAATYDISSNPNLCAPGATIVDGEEDEQQQQQNVATAQVEQQSSSRLGSSHRMGGSSLLERIQRRRARDAMEASHARDADAEDFAEVHDNEKDHDLSLNLVV